MPKFGLISQSRLTTCDERLQALMNEVIKVYDITVICGYRDQEAQNRAVAEGRSKLVWPRSLHNQNPSLAVDVAPWPLDWNDKERFYYMGGLVLGIAHGMGLRVQWGGHWTTLVDLPHFQIMEM